MKKNIKLVVQYGLTIFLSAFLLFQVQPLIAKIILPWFGGSASVWTTCMLFFQFILLLGYVYSHWIVKSLSPHKQSLLHIALLVISLVSLPITPNEFWKPTGAENPTLQILGLLLFSIGLPYFVLSTTGPLLQAWFAREKNGGIPYRLFALSNFGSMLALLAYPILIEPIFPTKWQSYFWSALFGVFVIVCGILAWRNRTSVVAVQAPDEVGNPPTRKMLLIWSLLAACPSILMVADTSFLTENIAPIPMIWVIPLALYLLSFIFCFERQGWYQRKIFLPSLVIALLILAILPSLGLNDLPIFVSMGINLASFFVVCMVCHGELSKQQPNANYLTIYFLMVAIGGVIGGFFVGIVAPYFFNGNYELSISIILVAIIIAALVFPEAKFKSGLFRKVVLTILISFIALLCTIRISDHLDELSNSEVSVRNFYGTLKVVLNSEGGFRTMRHGQISHGRQMLDPLLQLQPTTYYVQNSGVGRTFLIKNETGKPIKAGVIGLGAGALAGYGRKGDLYRFYEINPQVIELANTHFSFLSNTPASTEVILGDARLQLEKELAQNYDVLVVDAFSGDSVPIHLLTKEAFDQYFRHLKDDGVLAVHITNRYLNLMPVMKTVADHYGKQARIVKFEPKEGEIGFRSEWVVIANQPKFLESQKLSNGAELNAPPNFKMWSDDYSSLISIMN